MPREAERGVVRVTTSVDEAAGVLRAGGIVVYPTETLVGIGCAALDTAALRRLVALKGRAPRQPFPLLLPDAVPLEQVAETPPAALRLAARFWPGALTLVLPVLRSSPLRPPARGNRTVALRRSRHPVARALADALGGLLVATSANPSGRPAARRVDEVDLELARRADVVLTGGPLPRGEASTIVRVHRDGSVMVLREGSIPSTAVTACLQEPG